MVSSFGTGSHLLVLAHWKVALDRVHEAIQAAGVDMEIRLERVETSEEADKVGFCGSTILIGGVDPFVQENAPVGLSCRVYMTEDGIDGSPSVGQLAAALGERS